jgi:hypothetical protein
MTTLTSIRRFICFLLEVFVNVANVVENQPRAAMVRIIWRARMTCRETFELDGMATLTTSIVHPRNIDLAPLMLEVTRGAGQVSGITFSQWEQNGSQGQIRRAAWS